MNRFRRRQELLLKMSNLDLLAPMAAGAGNFRDNISKGTYIPESVAAVAGLPGRDDQIARPYESQARTHTQLPNSYEGQSMLLDTAIEGMMLEAPEAFVSYIYPLVEATELSVHFSTFKFNHAYVNEVAHEGVPRVVTAEKRTRRGRMRRRAIAIRGEVGAMSTAMGVEEFTLRARGVALCIIETMIMDTLYELTYSGSQNLEQTSIYSPGQNIVSRATTEESLTASIQRSQQQFGLWVHRFRSFLMQQRQVKGQLALILAPESAIYLEPIARKPGKNERFVAGEELNATPDLTGAQPIGSFAGMPVFEAPDVYFGNGRSGSAAITASAQFLTRERLCSEFFPMVMGNRRTEKFYDGMTCKDENACFSTSQRDVFLYSTQSDKMERVSFAGAVHAAGVGEDVITPEDPAYAIPLNVDDYTNPVRRAAKWNFFLDTRDGIPKAYAATNIGQLDSNVFERSDARQGAQTLIGKVARGGNPMDLYKKTFELLRMLENVTPNTDYVASLIRANYAINHDAAGNFVGQAPDEHDPDAGAYSGWCAERQWAAASSGGMLLPAYSPVFGESRLPPFMANWAGLKQLEELHYAGTQGWSEQICQMAADVVPFWEDLEATILAANPENDLLDRNARAPWEVGYTAGNNLFKIAFGQRMPIFLADLNVQGASGTGVAGTSSSGAVARAPVYLSIGLHELLNNRDIQDLETEGATTLISEYGRVAVTNPRLLPIIATGLAAEPTLRAVSQISPALQPGYAAIVSVHRNQSPEGTEDDLSFAIGSFANNLIGMSPLRAQAVVYWILSKAGLSDDQIRNLRGNFETPSTFFNEDQRKEIINAVASVQNHPAKFKSSKPYAYITEAENAIQRNGMAGEASGDIVSCIRTDISGNLLLADTDIDAVTIREAIRNAVATDGVVTLSNVDIAAAEATQERPEGASGLTQGAAQNLAVANWYRAPYTASPSQVRDLLANPVPVPVRIGNYEDGFSTPFEGVRGTGARAVPEVLLNRPEMERLENISSNRNYSIESLPHSIIHGNLMTQSSRGESAAPVGAGLFGMGASRGGVSGHQNTMLAERLNAMDADNFRRRVEDFANENNALLRTVMIACLGMHIDRAEYIASMLDHDMHVFFLNILMIQPAAAYSLDSAIMLLPGSATGNNYYGHASSMYGANATVQNFIGSYAIYTRAFTKRPENIIAMMDWRCRGVIGGSHVDFFPHGNVVNTIRSTEPEDRPSLIAVALPITENSFPKVISPSGRFVETRGLSPEYLRPHYSSADYENAYGHGLHAALAGQSMGDSPFYRRMTTLPAVSFRGQTVSYCNTGLSITQADSWRRQGCYPGAAEVYNGHRTYFPDTKDALDMAVKGCC